MLTLLSGLGVFHFTGLAALSVPQCQDASWRMDNFGCRNLAIYVWVSEAFFALCFLVLVAGIGLAVHARLKERSPSSARQS